MKLALVSFLAILRLSVPIVSRRIAPHDYSGQAGPARELSTVAAIGGCLLFRSFLAFISATSNKVLRLSRDTFSHLD